MDESTSTDDAMVEFVLGRTKADGFPSPAAWGRIFESSTALLLHDLEYYGLRKLSKTEGSKLDRLIVRDVPVSGERVRLRRVYGERLTLFYLSMTGEWLIVEIDIDHTRVLRHKWVRVADLAEVFGDDYYAKTLPVRLLGAILMMVEDRLEQAERHIETFRFARDALKPIVNQAEHHLPEPN
jgi:hypothetical protein